MKLLLLAGTAEARQLAAALSRDPRLEVVASLAGETKAPGMLPVVTRIGGFGGFERQEKYIKDNGIEIIIDATHPFATQISGRSRTICAALGLPYLRLLRPGWAPLPGDRWHVVDSPAEIAGIPPSGATLFLATGRKSLPDFASLTGYRLICRVIDPPERPFPYDGGSWAIGRPPFTVESEVALFRALRVDLLVTKDSGGAGARAKLDAARALGLPVALLRRPPAPAEAVATVEEALAWLEARL